MSLFLSEADRAALGNYNRSPLLSNLYWGLHCRTAAFASTPGLTPAGAATEWFHHVFEVVSDTALLAALTGDTVRKEFLRSTVLELVRRPIDDWVGPPFRYHGANPPCGNLETAHLAAAVALTLDLVPDVFASGEREEVATALREKGIALCREWILHSRAFLNWRNILTAGIAVPAAVLGDREAMEAAARLLDDAPDMIEPDGSYGESLQYCGYSSRWMLLGCEALVRAEPAWRDRFDLSRVARMVRFFRHSHLYSKPLDRWGAYPRPRAVNFNDSAALFGPPPELLLFTAGRLREPFPEEAGIARQFYEELYGTYPAQGPFEFDSFGFLNRPGFLSLLFLPAALETAALPAERLPLAVRFDNGNAIGRDSWHEEATVFAMNTSAEALHAVAHLHGDLNSIQLIHRRERLLADPGHSCYRSLVHGIETATATHNTCSFGVPEGGGIRWFDQTMPPARKADPEHGPGEPVRRAGRFLGAASLDDVTFFANDAGAAYPGGAVRRFERIALLAGGHAFFVIDRIEAEQPVFMRWNWLFNNRDGALQWKNAGADRMVIRRGAAGMKFFCLDGRLKGQSPEYGFLHDAYSPEPGGPGEGKPGSGILFRRVLERPERACTAVHAFALDGYGICSGWHLRPATPLDFALESPGAAASWHLEVKPELLQITETVSGRAYRIAPDADGLLTIERIRP